MSVNESTLLWALVQQATLLRRLEAAMKCLNASSGDVAMWEARYQRAVKDAGLEKEAADIEKILSE